MKYFKYSNIKHLNFLWLFALAAVVHAPFAAAQISLEPVTLSVLPGSPTTADDVVIRHDMVFSTGGYSIGGTSVTFLDPFHIQIDVFVRAPNPGDPVTLAITFLKVDSDLGMLAPGDYQYTSRVATIPRGQFPDPPTDAIFSQYPPAVRTGQFTVVPEPASLSLFAIGGWALTRRQRNS